MACILSLIWRLWPKLLFLVCVRLEPLSVQAIANFYISDDSLAVLRFLFILLVGFYGFFRIDEINSIRLHDIVVNTDHMTIYAAKPKNDQYREGHTSYLARSGKSTCPVGTTEKILNFYHSRVNRFLLFVVMLSLRPGNAFTLVGVCFCVL